MSAGYQNLYLEQGSTFSTTITLDDVYLNAYNLVGYTASSQMRRSYYSANVSATFSTVINTSTGQITLNLNAPTTANLAPGRYVYDTIITSASQQVIRILEGIIDVSPGVTR
jgi:hypothetical protein